LEASTTIRKMIAGNRIVVPTYQRAYSWETPIKNSPRKTHTDVFITDLEEYRKSYAISSISPYYFGHFMFEEKEDASFYVIDGQQRLTTIVIFLSALFTKLASVRGLSADEKERLEDFEDIVKRNGKIRFSTVDYDDELFRDKERRKRS
jgi:uncharacterized protein with ParB-like and HNH nuclease domain